jgi:hypothetical protein
VNIQIEFEMKSERLYQLRAVVDEKRVHVTRFSVGHVNVLVESVARRALHGYGKTFTDFNAAKSHYKSPEARAVIGLAQEKAKPQEESRP